MQANNIVNPTVQSIISGAEERIYDMTGMSVKLVIEPKYAEAEFLPRLAKALTDIWDIPMDTLKMKVRFREVVTYKQIFCMIARQKHNLCTFQSITTYLNYSDHTTAMCSLQVGNDMLKTKDAYFMAFYEPVKHLFDGIDS